LACALNLRINTVRLDRQSRHWSLDQHATGHPCPNARDDTGFGLDAKTFKSLDDVPQAPQAFDRRGEAAVWDFHVSNAPLVQYRANRIHDILARMDWLAPCE
jgi:hypothetical protein